MKAVTHSLFLGDDPNSEIDCYDWASIQTLSAKIIQDAPDFQALGLEIVKDCCTTCSNIEHYIDLYIQNSTGYLRLMCARFAKTSKPMQQELFATQLSKFRDYKSDIKRIIMESVAPPLKQDVCFALNNCKNTLTNRFESEVEKLLPKLSQLNKKVTVEVIPYLEMSAWVIQNIIKNDGLTRHTSIVKEIKDFLLKLETDSNQPTNFEKRQKLCALLKNKAATLIQLQQSSSQLLQVLLLAIDMLDGSISTTLDIFYFPGDGKSRPQVDKSTTSIQVFDSHIVMPLAALEACCWIGNKLTISKICDTYNSGYFEAKYQKTADQAGHCFTLQDLERAHEIVDNTYCLESSEKDKRELEFEALAQQTQLTKRPWTNIVATGLVRLFSDQNTLNRNAPLEIAYTSATNFHKT